MRVQQKPVLVLDKYHLHIAEVDPLLSACSKDGYMMMVGYSGIMKIKKRTEDGKNRVLPLSLLKLRN